MEDRNSKLAQTMLRWNFPRRHVRFEKHDIVDIPKSIFNIVDKFVADFSKDTSIGLYLHSQKKGTGKTLLATYICKELKRLKKVSWCYFWGVSQFMDEIKGSYDTPFEYERLISRALTVDVLVLDDFGKERNTPHTIDKLYMILNSRYNDMKPVIVTGNASAEDLVITNNSSFLDTANAITSRLSEMTLSVKVG